VLSPAARLNGSVRFQGRLPGTFAHQAPISLTLYQGGQVIGTRTATTDSGGNFVVSTLPPGTYDVVIKHPQSLSKRIPGMELQIGTPVNQDFGTLRAGDIDGNDVVDVLDFSRLRANFGSSTACGLFSMSGCADLDASGTVDIVDFSLLRANFGAGG